MRAPAPTRAVPMRLSSAVPLRRIEAACIRVCLCVPLSHLCVPLSHLSFLSLVWQHARTCVRAHAHTGVRAELSQRQARFFGATGLVPGGGPGLNFFGLRIHATSTHALARTLARLTPTCMGVDMPTAAFSKLLYCACNLPQTQTQRFSRADTSSCLPLCAHIGRAACQHATRIYLPAAGTPDC